MESRRSILPRPSRIPLKANGGQSQVSLPGHGGFGSNVEQLFVPPLVLCPHSQARVLFTAFWHVRVSMFFAVLEKLIVALLPSILLDRPGKADPLQGLDSVLGQVRVLAFQETLSLMPLALDPLRKFDILGPVVWNDAGAEFFFESQELFVPFLPVALLVSKGSRGSTAGGRVVAPAR